MTPEQVAQWIVSQGGETRREGPDANGITTIYTASGAYVTVGSDGRSRMLGHSSGDAATPEPATQSAAAQSGGSGVAQLTQQQVEQWIAQNGGPHGVQYSVEQKQIKNPDTASPEPYINIQVEVWRNSKTEAELIVRRGDDGNFEQIENKGADPNKPTSSAQTQQKPPGGREGPEGTPDPSKPGGFDNERPIWVVRDKDGNAVWSGPLNQQQREQWERDRNESAGRGRKTDAEVEKDKLQTAEGITPVDGRPGWRQKKTVKVEGGNRTEVTVYIDSQGNEHATLPEKPGDVKQQFVTINGQRYEVRATPQGAGKPDTIEYFDPNGAQIARLPVEAGKPHTETVTVNGRRYTRTVTVSPTDGAVTIKNYGPDGKEVSEIPAEGIGELPPDFPRYTPDLTKRGQGLFEYRDAVDRWMAANPGKLTWEKRNQILDQASKEAAVITGEFNVAAGILREAHTGAITQRGQDQSVASARLGAANTQVAQALSTLEKLGPYLGAGTGDAGKLFVGLQAAQMAHGTLMGGMRDVPRVELDPRLGAFADRTFGPAPSAPAPAGTPAPTASAAPASVAPAPPMTPEEARAQAREAVGPERAETIRRTPVFRPQPPVGGDPMTNLSQGPGAGTEQPGGNMAPGSWFTPTPATEPVSAMPDPMNRLSLLPETPSWHEQAQSQALRIEQPVAPTPPGFAFNRPLPPTFSPGGGGGGLGFGQFSLPQVPTQIPNLSAELDEQARREVLLEMGAA